MYFVIISNIRFLFAMFMWAVFILIQRKKYPSQNWIDIGATLGHITFWIMKKNIHVFAEVNTMELSIKNVVLAVLHKVFLVSWVISLVDTVQYRVRACPIDWSMVLDTSQ